MMQGSRSVRTLGEIGNSRRWISGMLKSFKEFIGWYSVKLLPVPLGEIDESPMSVGMVYVWSQSDDHTPRLLTEAIGNRTVHLTGQYSVRYDPPRAASTGAGNKMKGDWHLFDGSGEIAAWDTDSKARHGFPPGTKLPRSAYKELIRQHGRLTGLKGRILEDASQAVAKRHSQPPSVADLAAAFPVVATTPGLQDEIAALVRASVAFEAEQCARTAEAMDDGRTTNRPDLSLEASAGLFGMKGAAHTIALRIRERQTLRSALSQP